MFTRSLNLFFLLSIALFFTFTSCQKEALEEQAALIPTPTQTTENEVLQLNEAEANLLNEQVAARAANNAAKTTINLELEKYVVQQLDMKIGSGHPTG